jgi:hypothetical protein
MTYKTKIQEKNMAWFLPRPNTNHYKGGMPLYAEGWLLELAKDILEAPNASILNLFCGMNKQGVRVDLKENVTPDILADAHDFAKYFPFRKFDIVLADPPYSDEESSDLYGTPKINYKKWTSEVTKILGPRGILIVYHKYVMPNPDPNIYEVVKRVFIGNRIYHLPRVAIYFQKKITSRGAN